MCAAQARSQTMESRGERIRWDIALQEPEASPHDEVELEGSPVHHSFGRGCWKELAERVKLPRVALDAADQQYSTTAEKMAVGVVTSTVDVGGVRREGGSRVLPKTSGRGRGQQLHMAAVRRPGGHKDGGQRSSHSSRVASPDGSQAGTWSSEDNLSDSHHWPALGETVSKRRFSTQNLEVRVRSDQGPGILLDLDSVETDLPDWPLDTNTVCFHNLPLSVTSQELQQAIESFGGISHCVVFYQSRQATAYVRMEKESACEWVVSCFNGNPFNDSAQELVVYVCSQRMERERASHARTHMHSSM